MFSFPESEEGQGLTTHLLDIGMREPTLLTLLDERTVPPRAFSVFGRMSLDDHILNERKVDIPLSIVREERSDPKS